MCKGVKKPGYVLLEFDANNVRVPEHIIPIQFSIANASGIIQIRYRDIALV